MKGGTAIGVPGDVAGLYAAWERYGKLPWKVLLEPTIQMARDGFEVNSIMAAGIERVKDRIKKHDSLR